jgi:hypothetical protein
MLDPRQLENALDLLESRYREVEHQYIEKIGKMVRRIGMMNAASIDMLSVMMGMHEDVTEILTELTRATRLNEAEVARLLEQTEHSTFTDDRFRRALNHQPLNPYQKAVIRQYTQAVAAQTAQLMDNLSNTTAVSAPYQRAVDAAVLAVSTGLTDYNSAIRNTIRDIGFNGLQVQYESGYHRRLDTAVRQNILDATKQVAQKTAEMVGESLGYNAVEISAHLHSAPDHAPVQGRVFLRTEYDKMQSGQSFTGVDGTQYAGFKRPLMEWNCMHIVMPFDTRYSVRAYSDEQLAKWEADNQKGCEIGGKHMTTYQASQLMRKLETDVRRWKETAYMAKVAGDTALQTQAQMKITDLTNAYSRVCNASGLSSRRERMRVELPR